MSGENGQTRIQHVISLSVTYVLFLIASVKQSIIVCISDDRSVN